MTTNRINYRRLALTSGGMVAATVFSMIFNIVAGLLLARLLIPELYGVIAYFLRIFALVRFIGTVGLGAKLIEEISRQVEQDDEEGVQRSIVTLGAVRVALGLALLLGLMVISYIRSDSIFLWAGIAGFVASMADFMSATAQGFKLRTIVALMTVVQPLIYVLGILYVIHSHQTNTSSIYILFTGSFVTSLIVYALFVRLPALRRRSLSMPYLRSVALALGGLFILGMLNQLHLALATLILGEAKLFEAAAYFSASFSLVSMPAALGLTVTSSVFYPDLVRAVSQGDYQMAGKLLQTFLRGTLVIVALGTAATFVYADTLIDTLYPEAYHNSILSLQLLAPLVALLILQQFLNFGLFAVHRIDLTSRTMAIQVAIVLIGTIASLAAPRAMLITGLSLTYSITAVIGTLALLRDLRALIAFRIRVWTIPATMIANAVLLLLARQLFTDLFHSTSFEVMFLSGITATPFCIILSIFLVYDRRKMMSEQSQTIAIEKN